LLTPTEDHRHREARSTQPPRPRIFPWDDPSNIALARPISPALDNMPKKPRRLIATTIVISLAAHLAAIAAAWPSTTSEQFGAVSEKTDAISLSTSTSIVLESIQSDMAQAAAAAAASEAGSVQSAETKPQEVSEVKNVTVPDEPPPPPIKVADVTPTATVPADEALPVIRGGADPDAVSEVKAIEQAEKAVEEMPLVEKTKENEAERKIEREKQQKKKEQEKTAQEQSHQQVAGSTTSRASVAVAGANGRVSASQGNALSYAAQVRAEVARKKPPSSGHHGTAQVSFGIGRDGALSYVRLSQSSGNASQDQAALKAVEDAAPFGEPPPGVEPSQLRFAIPFYFR